VRTRCTKILYRTERDAWEAAKIVSRVKPTGWRVNVYRCDQCRYDGGARAWHWGNNRPRRRKQ
jgi:hypothetical protein